MVRLRPAYLTGTLLPFVVLAAVALAAVLHPDFFSEYGTHLFLASAVVLGLPHGAVDHLVIARLEGTRLMSTRVGLWLLGYLGLVGATLAVWWLAPVAVFVGFILLTWFHWGQGDSWFQHRVYDVPLGWDAIMLAGALPMLVPLVAHPEAYAEVAEAFVAATGAEVKLGRAIEALRVPAAVVLGLAASARVARARGGRFAVTAETIALAVFFVLVPPVAAIAIYFCFWHSTRHLARLSELLYEPDWRGWGKTLAAAVPLTLVSIGGLAALMWWVEGDDLFSVYLALIAALTVPHVVIVTWMDLRRLP